MSETTQEFGKWRSKLWPIYRFELKKLLPMLFMFFLITFNYTILRDTKDALIVTSSGAETIPFLKVWGVIPMAVIFMIFYAKLSNKLSKKALFYSAISPFLIFFALFALVIYPAREYLHPTELADKMQAFLPAGFAGFIAVFKNWSFSLFYILAELWGSVVLSLLFWGFANDIMKVSEAKRFYALLGAAANSALMISGPLIKLMPKISQKISAAYPSVDKPAITINLLVILFMLAGITIVGIYHWINKNVLTDPRFYSQDEIKSHKKEKPKMSLKESFAFLLKSKYIGLIAVLVIAYGISINIVEVTWKAQVKLQYPTQDEYLGFMGGFSFCTGVVSIIMAMFVGGNVIRKFGWGKAALVTPVVLLITGLGFFSVVIFNKSFANVLPFMLTNPFLLAVVIGAIQNIMSKSCKYSLFDPTKEMSYIPLDQESKVKGKAAIDVVGARLGKAGGSLMQQGLIVVLGSVAAMTPYIAGILLVIIAAWIVSANKLNKLFIEKTKEIPADTKAPAQEKVAIAKETQEIAG